MSARPTLWAPLDDPDARARYAALQRACPWSTAFAHLETADAFCDALGLQGQIGIVSVACGEVGQLAFVRRWGPFRVAVLPPLYQYLAPVAAPGMEPDEAVGAAAEALMQRFAQASLRLPPALAAAVPLDRAGWASKPLHTARTDLTEDPLASWSAAPRRTLRKHVGAYEILQGPEALEHAIRAALGAYDVGVPAAVLKQILAPLVAGARARSAVAFKNGSVEAGVVLLIDGRTAHYTLAGSTPGPAMTVLLGTLLPQLRAEGHAHFDWAGANTPSVAEFKRRLGGVRAPVLRGRVVAHPLLRVAHRLRRSGL